MHRHIKYLAKPSDRPDHTSVIIVEQTHIRDDLTPKGSVFEFGGIVLRSCNSPMYYSWRIPEVYLRGDEESENTRTIHIPNRWYPKFKAAVEAYNIQFGKQKNVYKHLKLRAVPNGYREYEVTILEQTHYLAEFSEVVVHNGSAFHPEHSAVLLCSHDEGAEYKEYVGPHSQGRGYVGTVYVKKRPGSKNHFIVSTNILGHLVTAVKEYNEYYSGK